MRVEKSAVLFSQLECVLDPVSRGAAFNMALDEVLLLSAPTRGVPLLRVYQWAASAVSFGYFTRHSTIAARWPGRECVRRITGGGTVPHGEDCTYTVVLPPSHQLAQAAAHESYHAIHAALAAWLHKQGVAAALADEPARVMTGLCFESPVAADVMLGSAKIAGAAQRRTRHGLLYQGSIQPLPEGFDPMELPGAFSAEWKAREPAQAELAEATRLAEEKYATRAWLERV